MAPTAANQPKPDIVKPSALAIEAMSQYLDPRSRRNASVSRAQLRAYFFDPRNAASVALLPGDLATAVRLSLEGADGVHKAFAQKAFDGVVGSLMTRLNGMDPKQRRELEDLWEGMVRQIGAESRR